MLYEQANGEQKEDLLRFDSLEEQVSDMEEATDWIVREQSNCIWKSSILSGGARWIGRKFASTAEVIEELRKEWPEGLAIYDRMMEQLREENIEPPQDMRRRAVWSEETGDEIDIDRLRRQQPFWRASKRQSRPGPATITLVTDVSTSSRKAPNKILWRGAAAVCLTELLERAGYRVELWSCNYVTRYCDDNFNPLLVATCLKRTSDPLDTSTLINAVSGWGFRTLTLGSYHLTKHEIRPGYGTPTRITKTQWERFTNDETVIQCSQVWDFNAAVALVKSSIQDLNGVAK